MANESRRRSLESDDFGKADSCVLSPLVGCGRRKGTILSNTPPRSPPPETEAEQAASPDQQIGGSPLLSARKPKVTDGAEPEGGFLALLLADEAPPHPAVVDFVRGHRWTFQGAAGLAERSRGFSFFVWSLLQMQRNAQLQEEGDCLEHRMKRACQAFVSAQSRRGQVGVMYYALTHFVCNSLLWSEWHKYLKQAMEDPRANQESFLVPRLEQVWSRFQRLKGTLAEVFGVLDERFVWKHRLLPVSDLLVEHMRKRGFPRDLYTKNELFLQATIKDDTLKSIKFAFGDAMLAAQGGR